MTGLWHQSIPENNNYLAIPGSFQGSNFHLFFHFEFGFDFGLDWARTGRRLGAGQARIRHRFSFVFSDKGHHIGRDSGVISVCSFDLKFRKSTRVLLVRSTTRICAHLNYTLPAKDPKQRVLNAISLGDHRLGDHRLGDHRLGDHRLGDHRLGGHSLATMGHDNGRPRETTGDHKRPQETIAGLHILDREIHSLGRSKI